MSLTKATYSMIKGAPVNVLDYGASTSSSNCSAEFAAALAAVPTNGTLYIPAGVYRAYLIVWRGDITIMGDGSASSIIKLPNNCPAITVPHDGVPNPITGLPNVIEIGKCALGNAAPAYANVTIKGLTVDGNYANNTEPVTDLFGHGCIITKTSNVVIEDFVAKDCFMTGIDLVINSNYANITARTDNCGQAALIYPNFDINSSKYGLFNIISSGGAYGGRMLDNCFGNHIDITVYSPDYSGFVYNNQTLNVSYGNTLNVNVIDGCGLGQAISVGTNCFNSTVNLNCYSVAGIGLLLGGASALYPASGNTISVNGYKTGTNDCSITEFATFNKINVVAKEPSFVSSGNFSVSCDGSHNQLSVVIQEGTPGNARGLVFTANADENRLVDAVLDTNLLQTYNDLGTNNRANYPTGTIANIASGTAISIPFNGTYFTVTGTNGITQIAAPQNNKGRQITLTFTGSLTLFQKTTGLTNMQLAGGVDFAVTANDNITFICNGTDYLEISRTVI